MNYLVWPNIFLSNHAEKQAKSQGISDADISYTVKDATHTVSIAYNTYEKRRLFPSKYQVIVYCKWETVKQQWWVSSCFKRAQ